MWRNKPTYLSAVGIAAAFLVFDKVELAAGWAEKPFPQWLTVSSYLLLLVGCAGLVWAYSVSPADAQSRGGKGGTGTASGIDSTALGGDGGGGAIGQGGDCGDGTATGRGSYAKGGKGGDS